MFVVLIHVYCMYNMSNKKYVQLFEHTDACILGSFCELKCMYIYLYVRVKLHVHAFIIVAI